MNDHCEITKTANIAVNDLLRSLLSGHYRCKVTGSNHYSEVAFGNSEYFCPDALRR